MLKNPGHVSITDVNHIDQQSTILSVLDMINLSDSWKINV